MISIGALLLLFVAYQLWGTGLRTNQAQSKMKDNFEAQMAEVQRSTGVPSAPSGGSPADGQSAAAPAPLPSYSELAKDPKVREYARTKKYRSSETLGKITIPKIGVDFWYLEGVDLSLLTDGPGHFPSTPFPGQPGNAALAGHRTTWQAPFNRVDELVPGDKITIETLQGKFTYEVIRQANGLGSYIVPPTDVSILDNKGDNRLTLMACHPKYSAAQRIVVSAKLIDNPAETSPRSDPVVDELTALPDLDGVDTAGPAPAPEPTGSGELTALASGDDSARAPAMQWAAAAALIWLAVAVLGHFYRRVKWPLYAVALPLFGFCIWHSFELINRALPAAY